MPSNYIISDKLRAAYEVARDLQMPLLVTGEPGTGKTELAKWIAEQEGFHPDIQRFNTKTTSIARDLFYRYDAIRHFREAQHHKKSDSNINPLDFIYFEALGRSIIAARQHRFVVLIDEIDKAPRDFPNDILFEFEEMAFRIEEVTTKDWMNYDISEKIEFQKLHTEPNADKIKAELNKQGFIQYDKNKPKPFLLLTSNSEKNLPDAFLRRCIFFHIDFPSKTDLAKIIQTKIKLTPQYEAALDTILEKFLAIRRVGLRKNPATAELISWVSRLQSLGFDPLKLDDKAEKDVLNTTFPILAKNKEDLEKLTKN
jgi:MoxR-like ATPase